MNVAKKRGPNHGVPALNALLFIKINGEQEEYFDRIAAAKAWVEHHLLVDDTSRSRGPGRTGDDTNAVETEVPEGIITGTAELNTINLNVVELGDEFDQLNVDEDLLA